MESVMTKVKLIGAVVLSALLVGPAMAARHNEQPRSERETPVVDALHFGYGGGACGYHSGPLLRAISQYCEPTAARLFLDERGRALP
jgi:hypothetical protein